MIVLLADFGSTYTKLIAVDSLKQDIIATSSAFSTVNEDIKIGYLEALEKLEKKTGKLTFDKVLACSSAKGGLKMASIGLVPELTVEAAKRTCMGAGAKVEMVFSFELTSKDIEKIKKGNIDIILLAGGIDGGNKRSVKHNIDVLANSKLNIPIIYAGNQALNDYVEEMFTSADMSYTIVDNIMGKLNKLNMTAAKACIHDIFLERIIESKGIKAIEALIDKVIFPTPEAVLKASLLFSKGLDEDGLGELMVIDVGGATTDIYSMSFGNPSRMDVVMKGLEEPYDKRTVEGDLGLRHTSGGILPHLSKKTITSFEKQGIDLEKSLEERQQYPTKLYDNNYDDAIDSLIAKTCIKVAVDRHVGIIEPYYTIDGNVYYQIGKDLTNIKTIIGTGGPIIYHQDPKELLMQATKLEDVLSLKPKAPNYYLDKYYILSAMGLLSTLDPSCALAIMKKRIIKI